MACVSCPAAAGQSYTIAFASATDRTIPDSTVRLNEHNHHTNPGFSVLQVSGTGKWSRGKAWISLLHCRAQPEIDPECVGCDAPKAVVSVVERRPQTAVRVRILVDMATSGQRLWQDSECLWSRTCLDADAGCNWHWLFEDLPWCEESLS